MNRLLIALIAVVALGAVAANTFFVVDQRQQVVVVKLGEPVRVINPSGAHDPGLKTKIPFVESLVSLDKRNQAVEASKVEVLSADRQPLVLDAFIRYRITDPLAFYRTLRNQSMAKNGLGPLINSSLRQVLGSASAGDIISGRRPDLMAKALDDVRARAAAADLGIEVIDLRIEHVELPAASAEVVYRRMRSNLQRQAAQIRAQGEASARTMMAKADREATVTLAKANQQAAGLRGDGEARAASLYAASYGKDPRFAAFYLSMQAYEKALARGDTTLVLSPDSDFFKYFKYGPNAK
ncbi:MAG: protease modulator HflC [Caulobacteraceae bacterium]